jgi:outer membrane protein OmpA-like peptidoglycan-associated protein
MVVCLVMLVGIGIVIDRSSRSIIPPGGGHHGLVPLAASLDSGWNAFAPNPVFAAALPAGENDTDKSKVSDQPDLVAFSSGALIVQKPQEYDGGWAAFWMLDELPKTGWATPKGVISNQTMVIELPDRSILTNLEFDDANTENPGRSAKDVTVEMSDISMQTGFLKVADVTLNDHADGQTFPVQALVPGRWVRLTFHNNHGDPDYLELMDFKARGKRLTTTPFPEITGTYSTNFGDMHIRQQGTSVVGCYEHAEGLLAGGIEGRVMKLSWRETGKDGPAIMVFSSEGKELFGLWWYAGESGEGSIWNGTKKTNEVGTCPHWKGGVEQQMASDLEQNGKVRVYGINFDTDSDHIRAESHSTLDQIVTMLKAKPDWKLTVEGHTDATSTPEHNQQLSERRATSVKAYLEAAGIDASRLTTVGYGATKPVASNDTEMGRAQNRRVELVKM